MEIKVTHIVELDCSQFSDSIHNSGLDNIGQITWRNAVEHTTETPLVTGEQQNDLRSWIRGFGAWDQEEIDAMSDTETNALLLQFVAGDVQAYENAEERGELAQWEESEGGRLFKCDVEGDAEFGEWFFYVGE